MHPHSFANNGLEVLISLLSSALIYFSHVLEIRMQVLGFSYELTGQGTSGVVRRNLAEVSSKYLRLQLLVHLRVAQGVVEYRTNSDSYCVGSSD